jgi:hypothetical protein
MLFLATFPILYVWEAAATLLATFTLWPTLLSSPLSFANDEIVQLQKLSRI